MIKFKATVYQKGNKVGKTYEFNRKTQENAQEHLDSLVEELEKTTGVTHEWKYNYIENLTPQDVKDNSKKSKTKSTSSNKK